MATAAVTYSFTAATTAVASQVNQNFTDLVNFLNNSVIHKDATVAFTGVPTGPATDPTTTNHLVRKSYADGLVVVTAWTAVTFQNSWVNYGGSQQAAQYRKRFDEIQVRGVIKDGTANATAFTLPAGFRPPGTLQFAGKQTGFDDFAIFNIGTDGTFVPTNVGGAGADCSFFCSFSVTA